MAILKIQCAVCGKDTSRYIVTDGGKKAGTKRLCRNCAIRGNINFEIEYRNQVKAGVLLKDLQELRK